MAEAAPPVAGRLQTPPKRHWRWLKVLVLCLAVFLFGWEAYVISPTVRVGVVEALGWVGPLAVPAVLGFCQDRDDEVQAAAYDVLVQWGAKAVPSVAPVLAEPDPRRRELAASALARVGPAAVSAVPALAAAAAKDPDSKVRNAAIMALGSVRGGGDDAAAVQALLAPLQDADPEVRKAALRSLHDFGPGAKAAVSALVERLKDDDADVRQHAAEDLEQIGPDAREAIPALTEALKDPDRDVRREAGEALEAIGQPPHGKD